MTSLLLNVSQINATSFDLIEDFSTQINQKIKDWKQILFKNANLIQEF